MKSIYQLIKTYEGDFQDIFTKLRLMDIFKPVLEKFDPPTAKKVIRFIAFVYSKESEFILMRESLRRVKDRCAKEAALPERLIPQVAYLQKEDEYDSVPDMIRMVATKYLAYQNEPNNEELKSLYDLRNEMLQAAAMPVIKDEHYKLKYDCRQYATSLKKDIEEIEKKMRDEDSQLKAQVQELKEKHKTSANVVRPEHAAGLYPRQVYKEEEKDDTKN